MEVDFTQWNDILMFAAFTSATLKSRTDHLSSRLNRTEHIRLCVYLTMCIERLYLR